MLFSSWLKMQDLEQVYHMIISSLIRPRSGYQRQTCCTIVGVPTGDSIFPGAKSRVQLHFAPLCSPVSCHFWLAWKPTGTWSEWSSHLALLPWFHRNPYHLVASTEPCTLSECLRSGLLLEELMALMLQGSESAGLPPPLTHLQAGAALW